MHEQISYFTWRLDTDLKESGSQLGDHAWVALDTRLHERGVAVYRLPAVADVSDNLQTDKHRLLHIHSSHHLMQETASVHQELAYLQVVIQLVELCPNIVKSLGYAYI